jgi:cell shape-determining protein MreC
MNKRTKSFAALRDKWFDSNKFLANIVSDLAKQRDAFEQHIRDLEETNFKQRRDLEEANFKQREVITHLREQLADYAADRAELRSFQAEAGRRRRSN